MTEKGYAEKIRTWARVFKFSLVPWVFVFIAASMAMGGPGAAKSPLTLMFFYSVATYPIVFVVSNILALRISERGNMQLAFKMTMLPVVNIASALFSNVLIGIFCGGQFTCV